MPLTLHRIFKVLLAAACVVLCTDARAAEVELRVLAPVVIGEASATEIANLVLDADTHRANGQRWRFVTVKEQRDFVVRHLSTSPTHMTRKQVARWQSRTKAAVSSLAHEDLKRAIDTLGDVNRTTARTVDALGRRGSTYKNVLDACLYLVRALWEDGQHGRAYDQTHRCRRLAPLTEPTPYRHTPEVRRLIRRLDAELASIGPRTLVVEANRSGCKVRVNGVALGKTPFERSGFAPGQYAVQVECGSEPGRVHQVRIDGARTPVYIHADFDHAVHDVPGFYLQFGSQVEFDKVMYHHADRLKLVFGARHVTFMVLSKGKTQWIEVDSLARTMRDVTELR